MKVWLGHLPPSVLVGLAFVATGALVHGTVWQILALWGCYTLLNIFFVQRYPKHVALKWAIWKLKPGEKVEVEGT